MSGVITEIEQLREELEELNAKRDQLKSQIKTLESDLDHVENTDEQKEEIDESIENLENQLYNVNIAISNTEERLQELTGKNANEASVRNVAERVESVLSKVEDEYEDIQNKQDSVDELQKRIQDKEEQIEGLEETARGLLKRSTSAALGEQFANRKSELESNLKYWRWASIGSIAFLLGSAVFIYYDIITTEASISVNVSKLALILPISVAVWFSVSNYSRQKRLMEEYEFKARMALSLSGFREVLQEDTTDENGDLIAEFVMETMEKIYSNPQQNISSENSDRQDDPLGVGQRPLVDILKRLNN